MLTFILGVLTSLVAMFLFPQLQDMLAAAIARYLGWIPFRRRLNLTGIWSTAWQVKSDAYPEEVKDENTRVYQFANRIYSSFEDEASDTTYYIVGKVEDNRHVTGTWYDGWGGGYYGSFQLVLDPATRGLEGQWIGWGKSGNVKNGKLYWVNKHHPVTRSA